MSDRAGRYLARQEFFGSLLFDREQNQYVPFGEQQTAFLRDGHFGPPVNKLEARAFAAFESLCRERGVIDDSGRFPHGWAASHVGKGHLSAPLKLSLNVTSHCNLRCRHCYSYLRSGEKAEMDVARAAELIDQMATLGVMQLSIKGGEPFCHADLFAVLDHAAARGVVVTIITNGLLIDAAVARRLSETSTAYVTVSLEGVDAATHDQVRGPGTFERTLQSCAAIKSQFGRALYLYFTLNRLNVGQVARMFALASEIGVDGLRFRPVLPLGRASANTDLAISGNAWRKALEQIAEVSRGYSLSVDLPVSDVPPEAGESDLTGHLYGFGCVAGSTFVHVDPLGNVYPCQYLESADYLAGNVFTTPLEQLWAEAPVLRTFRALEADATCASCRSLSHCRGGCRARAILLGGGRTAPDPWCCEAGDSTG